MLLNAGEGHREWPAQFTEELLELLWVLDYTVNMSSDLIEFFETVLKGELLTAADLPGPTQEQRQAPRITGGSATTEPDQLSLDEL